MNTLLPEIDLEKLYHIFEYDRANPMIFSSGLFLWVFLGFITIYALLKKQDTLRILFVTLFSYYFYYKSSGMFFILLALVTVCDYYFAKCIVHYKSTANRKLFVTLSVLLNIGLLVYFKYTNFFAELVCNIQNREFNPFDIALPVGISFFTFQSLSYTIDVYRGRIQPLDRLLDYAFYISFFPQLVAGPIVRARDFIPQIRKPLFVSVEMFNKGIFFIICGLFKKAVISDYIGVNFVERIFANPQLYSGVENLMGVYGYAMQIYCDFSGYSDMAIGIALLLGFHFNINFDSPYQSASITEFWRRWHISLSSWLRDYLYIPLGGNRSGRVRQLINLMITMLLGGLWHGDSLNFLLWGGFHGLALVCHKLWRDIRKKDKADQSKGFFRFMGVLVTFHFVCFTWIFFRHQNFSEAFNMIHQIVYDFKPGLFFQLISGYWQVFILIGIGFALHFMPRRAEESFFNLVQRTPLIGKAILIVVLVFIVIQIKSSDIQPFIYFKF
mgnify:FL=1